MVKITEGELVSKQKEHTEMACCMGTLIFTKFFALIRIRPTDLGLVFALFYAFNLLDV